MDPALTSAPTAARALALAALLAGSAFAAPPPLPEQSTEAGGVTIAVQPASVGADAATWSFRVSLSTIRGEIRDDLLRTAVLLNRAAGRQEPALAWAGDAAGARRTGTLSFKALKPQPGAIELRIQRAGEKAPRVYRWDLDCPCGDHAKHTS